MRGGARAVLLGLLLAAAVVGPAPEAASRDGAAAASSSDIAVAAPARARTGSVASRDGAAAPLELVQTIPLPDVAGRLDHMAVDLSGLRLFVAALGNHSVEVIDLAAARHIRSLGRLGEPQGVAFVPWSRRLVAADGSGGVCHVFGDSLDALPAIPLWGDADNIQLDTLARRIYVGYGEGGLVVLDGAARRAIATLELGAHPEGFALERAGPRIFVSLPDRGRIAVVDRRRRAVIARWPLGRGSAAYPVALDEAARRLFVGCRHPARVLVMDARTGARIDSVEIAADVDGLSWDPVRRRLYASCGEGAVEVFAADSAGALGRAGRIETRTGARTSLFVPALDRLFVAVPADDRAAAEIRVYAARP